MPESKVCKHCGRCQECGRGPAQPAYPYGPYWVSPPPTPTGYPWWIYGTTNSTITIGTT